MRGVVMNIEFDEVDMQALDDSELDEMVGGTAAAYVVPTSCQ
jgi:hypothetical protein